VFHAQRPYRCAAVNWRYGPYLDIMANSGDPHQQRPQGCMAAWPRR